MATEQVDVHKELELKLCKESFVFFEAFMAKKHLFMKKFTLDYFDNVVDDIFQNLKPFAREIINCPPRLGKTFKAQCFVAWKFLQDPTSSFLYLSYDSDLAVDKSAGIKDMTQFLASYFGIDDLKLKRGRMGKELWYNQAGGYVFAKATGKGVTGYGCSTAMIIDDPNKATDWMSSKLLAKRNQIYATQIRNRINADYVPIIVIQQRVASIDLTGYLLSGKEKFNHTCIPAVLPNGESCCPSRLSLEAMEALKQDAGSWNAQYMQTPMDEVGHLFSKKRLVWSPAKPPLNGMQILISCDPGFKTASENDYSAIAVIATCGPKFYIIEALNLKADITQLVSMIKRLRQKYGNGARILFEGKANGVAAVQILRKELSGVLEYNPTKSKIERAMMCKFLFDSCSVEFCIPSIQWATVENQFATFPYGEHDDMVDAVVQGINFFLQSPQFSRQGVPIGSNTPLQPEDPNRMKSLGRNTLSNSTCHGLTRRPDYSRGI